MKQLSYFALAIALAFSLSACEDMPEWMGGSNDKTPLEGKRVAVLSDTTLIKPDASMESLTVNVPDAQTNTTWLGQGGSPSGLTGNLAWSGAKHRDSTSIGKGNSWRRYSNISPVAANGKIFAMDASGYVSAHDSMHIDKTFWTNNSLVENDEPELLGGGLAYENGKLFVVSGFGKVAALEASTGKELWKVSLGIPLRNAPKASGDKLFVLSADNQLFVLDAGKGTQLWNHRGITENVGFTTSVSPSIKDTIVLIPYSSGELHAMDASSGQEIWNDTLILSRHTTATGGFSGIGGAPVIADDTVYVGDSGGFYAAIALLSGRRLWEQDFATLNPGWVAGDYIYLLSDRQELIAIYRQDGRIKWTQQLPRFEDEKKRKNAYIWRGPILAGGQLLVAGQHGVMLAFSPTDGKQLSAIDIPDKITNTPIVAEGRIFLITQDARLISLY